METSKTAAIAATLAGAALAAGRASAKSADELLREISTYTFGQSREPLTEVEDWVRVNLDSAENSRAIAHALAGLLNSSATKDCKLFVCRQLAVSGTADNLPELAPLLLKADTADMARYALQRMADPRVDGALLDALDKTEAAAVAGIVDTLGERRSPAAVKPLAKLAAGGDEKVAECAIAALGKIASKPAAKALDAAKGKVGPGLRRSVSDAQLQVAETWRAAGDTAGAKAIYASLTGGDEEEPIRKAASLGLAAAGQ